MMRLIRKVCGMREADNIRQVEALNIDWMGFIFFEKSSRFVEQCPTYLPTKTKRVGVFVNAPLDYIRNTMTLYALDGIQLHGQESPDFCETIKQKLHPSFIIKAFSIYEPKDLAATTSYETCCDYFLFDTKCETHGGSGQTFDWNILSNYQGKIPFLLSGGIGLESSKALSTFHHPRWQGIDVNSRFELAPGLKDTVALSNFLQQLR